MRASLRQGVEYLRRALTTSARRVSRRSAPAPTVYVDTGLVITTIGRPNVGKSTLFNALASSVRGRGSGGIHNPSPFVFVRSVVDPAPGVTRDPREAHAAVGDLRFTIVDTPGIERPLSKELGKEDNAKRKIETNTDAQRLKHLTVHPVPSLVQSTAFCDDVLYRRMYDVMEAAAVRAVQRAHVAMLILDGVEGVTPIDVSIAEWLRAVAGASQRPGRLHADGFPKQVLVVVNKCDKVDAGQGEADALGLGLGEPIALSGEQKLGFGDLYNYINSVYQEKLLYQSKVLSSVQNASVTPTAASLSETQGPSTHNNSGIESVDSAVPKQLSREPTAAGQLTQEIDDSFEDELVVGVGPPKGEEPLSNLVVSIIGRPNVGKSTLLNRLVGEQKSIVGPASGVTRDAVLCEWKPSAELRKDDEIPIWLIDTAGVRHESRVRELHLERESVRTSLRALRHSHVVLLVLDAEEPLIAQDLKLADLIIAEGRAAVIVVNKMDKIPKSHLQEWRSSLQSLVDNKLSEIVGVEIVELSAEKWENGDAKAAKLYRALQRARRRWEKRVSTSALNRFMQRFNERIALIGGDKAKRNRRGVAKFASQKKIRPPMFRIDGASAVSPSYLRALANAIRSEFGFEGVPLRIKRPSRRG